jgi:hypothetical protein
MKRIIALSLLPTAAFAHAGDHAQGGFWTNLRHLISEPDHMAMLAVAATVVAALVWLRKGRAE